MHLKAALKCNLSNLKQGALKWRSENPDKFKEHCKNNLLKRVISISKMNAQERIDCFSRGRGIKSTGWKGHYKFTNDENINFIFFTRSEAASITGINSSTIQKYTNTDKKIVQGKFSGFRVFRDKELLS